VPPIAAGARFPHELSGGMQQRIGLARALAIDPAIMLMDEPFSAIDAQTREVLQEELLRIQREIGKTTLFVTHDLDEAIYLSNRVVVLAAKPGRVKRVIDIPFELPRPPLTELRGDPRFQAVRAGKRTARGSNWRSNGRSSSGSSPAASAWTNCSTRTPPA